MTAARQRTDPFRITLETFLSGSARNESDRRMYRLLLVFGGTLLFFSGGPLLSIALLVVHSLLDETYAWHNRRARGRPIETLGRGAYNRLLIHYTATVVSFSAISISGALAGTVVGAGLAVLLVVGQLLNSISYETRSRETSIIAGIVVAVTSQLCTIAICYSHGLTPLEWAFLNGGAALLSVYWTHVLLITSHTHRNLIERTEALADATHGQALGRLASGIAHDFNNLLTVMRGNIDLIAEVPEADRPTLLRDIGEAADRGGKLVRRLLDQSRLDEDVVQHIALPGFIDTFTTFARRVLPSNIELRQSCAPDLALQAEPHLFEAALLNIVVNARDAMPEGGTIDIDVRQATARDDPPSADPFVRIAITDTGHGMTPDVLARATDALTTTKARGKGTGLGLAMVLAFAQESGGVLRLASGVGKGTTVTVLLPA